MKYVNTQLVTKDNIIRNFGEDNEIGNFRFKDYENIISEGKYMDLESDDEP